MAKEADKIRINFDLSSDLKERVEELQEDTHSGSISEVFRRALALLDKVTQHAKEGGELVLRDKKGREKIVEIL